METDILYKCHACDSLHSPRLNQSVISHYMDECPSIGDKLEGLNYWLYPVQFIETVNHLPLLNHFHDEKFSVQMKALATIAHEGQKRDGGNPYIVHPGRIAGRVRNHRIASEVTEAVAWGHDCIEDTVLNYAFIERHFPGTNIAFHIQELTNVSKYKIPKENRKTRKEFDRNRIAKASVEAKVIKMFDRIDNVSDMAGKEEGFAQLYCDESVLLAKVLRSADRELNDELLEAIEQCRKAHT